MKLLDVNILVQVHREDADRHDAVKSWLEQAIQGTEVVAVSELALSGCLRIITHPKVFIDPTPLDQALEFVADFHDRENVLILGPGERHWSIFMDLSRGADRASLSLADPRPRFCPLSRTGLGESPRGCLGCPASGIL